MLHHYDKLKELLSAIIDSEKKQLFPHIDLWNRQVEFLEVEQPFLLPACFIEFTPLTWENISQGIQRGTAIVRLHTITEWNSEKDDTRRLNLPEQLFKELHGKKIGDSPLTRIASEINHDHDNIVESVETYRFKINTNP